MFAVGDLSRSGDDSVGLLGGKQAEILVHLRAGGLQQGHRPDLVAIQPAEGDREVLHGPLGLSPPQSFGRNPHLAHGVVLNAVLAFDGHVFLAVVRSVRGSRVSGESGV